MNSSIWEIPTITHAVIFEIYHKKMNNSTLNKDINLIERENGYWDYEFQYGDLVLSENNQSLRNGLIIACLTSWNYLNRQGNPTYSVFGNRAYEELKKKKSSMVEYKIRQYFIEVLNRIRRVNRIIDLQVLNHPTDPNCYNVAFTVEAINNEIINGQFNIGETLKMSSTHLNITKYGETTSPTTPTYFTVNVETEYGSNLENEIIFAYHLTNDGEEEYLGAYLTGTMIPVYPFNSFGYEKIMFKYNGNSLFNGCTDKENSVLSIPFYFTVDKNQELILYKNKDYDVKAWLGKIVSTVDEMTDTTMIYLVFDGNDDYNKYHYDGNSWVSNSVTVYNDINKPNDLQDGELRLFVEDTDGKLHIIEHLNRENDHITYTL